MGAHLTQAAAHLRLEWNMEDGRLRAHSGSNGRLESRVRARTLYRTYHAIASRIDHLGERGDI